MTRLQPPAAAGRPLDQRHANGAVKRERVGCRLQLHIMPTTTTLPAQQRSLISLRLLLISINIFLVGIFVTTLLIINDIHYKGLSQDVGFHYILGKNILSARGEEEEETAPVMVVCSSTVVMRPILRLH